LKVTTFYRVLEFSQDDYMKDYIMKNTNSRATARNKFEKDLFKLLNNSAYGRTLMNVRKRINFRLVTSEDKALAIRNTRIRMTIFNESCVGVHLAKQQVRLDKPIFIGQTVLDASKEWMCNFHYNVMLKHFSRENLDVLFTDTDSLCYHVKSKNTIKEIRENPKLAKLKENRDPFEFMFEKKSYFDLSEYPKDHNLHDRKNEKVVGKFKNESIDQIIEFVGLRSKLYAYITENSSDKDKLVFDEHKKCKGVKTSVVEKDISFADYRNTQENRVSKDIEQNSFRSYHHQIYTESTRKTALSYNDDKCYIEDDNIHCVTFGHYKIRK
jgi:hypothetical protein